MTRKQSTPEQITNAHRAAQSIQRVMRNKLRKSPRRLQRQPSQRDTRCAWRGCAALDRRLGPRSLRACRSPLACVRVVLAAFQGLFSVACDAVRGINAIVNVNGNMSFDNMYADNTTPNRVAKQKVTPHRVAQHRTTYHVATDHDIP